MTWKINVNNYPTVPKASMTHVFKENLQNTTSLFVDETRDTLDTTTAGKTADSGLGDTCEVD